jgi:large conductance mechanosensitive channel
VTGFKNFILRGNLVELAVAFIMGGAFATVITATVVYFFIVVPYTTAKEKYFPSPEPGTPEDVVLLQEIRDLLAAQGGQSVPSESTTPSA